MKLSPKASKALSESGSWSRGVESVPMKDRLKALFGLYYNIKNSNIKLHFYMYVDTQYGLNWKK